MKFLILSLFITMGGLQSAFASIPEGQKEFECGVESVKGILDTLVRAQNVSNIEGDVTIQYAYTKQEAMENFLKSITPGHSIALINNRITLIHESGSAVTDTIHFLECAETK